MDSSLLLKSSSDLIALNCNVIEFFKPSAIADVDPSYSQYQMPIAGGDICPHCGHNLNSRSKHSDDRLPEQQKAGRSSSLLHRNRTNSSWMDVVRRICPCMRAHESTITQNQVIERKRQTHCKTPIYEEYRHKPPNKSMEEMVRAAFARSWEHEQLPSTTRANGGPHNGKLPLHPSNPVLHAPAHKVEVRTPRQQHFSRQVSLAETNRGRTVNDPARNAAPNHAEPSYPLVKDRITRTSDFIHIPRRQDTMKPSKQIRPSSRPPPLPPKVRQCGFCGGWDYRGGYFTKQGLYLCYGCQQVDGSEGVAPPPVPQKSVRKVHHFNPTPGRTEKMEGAHQVPLPSCDDFLREPHGSSNESRKNQNGGGSDQIRKQERTRPSFENEISLEDQSIRDSGVFDVLASELPLHPGFNTPRGIPSPVSPLSIASSRKQSCASVSPEASNDGYNTVATPSASIHPELLQAQGFLNPKWTSSVEAVPDLNERPPSPYPENLPDKSANRTVKAERRRQPPPTTRHWNLHRPPTSSSVYSRNTNSAKSLALGGTPPIANPTPVLTQRKPLPIDNRVCARQGNQGGDNDVEGARRREHFTASDYRRTIGIQTPLATHDDDKRSLVKQSNGPTTNAAPTRKQSRHHNSQHQHHRQHHESIQKPNGNGNGMKDLRPPTPPPHSIGTIATTNDLNPTNPQNPHPETPEPAEDATTTITAPSEISSGLEHFMERRKTSFYYFFGDLLGPGGPPRPSCPPPEPERQKEIRDRSEIEAPNWTRDRTGAGNQSRYHAQDRAGTQARLLVDGPRSGGTDGKSH